MLSTTIDRKGVCDDSMTITTYRGAILPELNNGLQRVGHTIVVYKHDLYLYGGYGPKNVYPTGIFCNVKMTLQWKEMRGVGVVPGGRANHSAILHEKKMIVFGGHRNLDVFDDLYILNLETMRWEKVNCERAQGPGPVFSHVAVYVPPTQAMVVIGGFHQRQHNMYIAHSFDIRNRVWNGIRGPNSVNPLHVQMCCAAYHSPTSSIIVIGIVEESVLLTGPCDAPSVFMMNVHSGMWVEVKTPVSPETPISFNISSVWEYFILNVISLGGVYDDSRQEWLFPMLLTPIVSFLAWRKVERASPQLTTNARARTRARCASYGLFRLQLRDMTWSMVPIKFPRRVVTELMARKTSRHGSMGGQRGTGEVGQHSRISMGSKRLLPVFSASGVSRFQRKYAFAATESSAMRGGSRAPHTLVVMHGGIGTEDYIMLLFTPVLKRRMVNASNSADSVTIGSDSDLLAASINSRSGSTAYQFSMGWDDEQSVSETELCRLVSGGEKRKESRFSREEVADPNVFVGRTHRLGSDPTLLPTLPSTRGSNNTQRFAVLYHSRSAVHTDKLLPDATCPVAVLDEKYDVAAWAQNFYTETRQWIASRLGATREEEKAAHRKKKKRGSIRTVAEDSDDSLSSSSSIRTKNIGDTLDTRSLSTLQPISPKRPKDFFLDKNLEVFDFKDVEIQRVSYHSRMPFILPGETPESIGRLSMRVKRTHEVQRLPTSVFQRSSLGNVTDVGGATAFLIMTSALARFADGSYEAERQRALIRWRYLRVMVLNGEANFIMYRVNQEEAKLRGIEISSTAQLTLAPELHNKGLTTKVPTRPVPYTVPVRPTVKIRSAEVTSSGLVLYHFGKSNKGGIS
ncbi:hypothetical protein TraAM80_04708 [Trypanosoma rangeli]|uniref:Galactose oxidase n=1 Tax=Trypanosoma rangeli TaxID=5698 RepID=A0A422NI37_TRYRA|nr:uncharacterized protein TraAM80_04708 [Trypanosoma rangeli]RNF05148.1 hypothetical protein TraAM80_04708 [Trypanosoma rangeli]|eukprot:RNF05148.1 hypothetical protein TraAM80_04708 [Trypanosoma rangeli]